MKRQRGGGDPEDVAVRPAESLTEAAGAGEEVVKVGDPRRFVVCSEQVGSAPLGASGEQGVRALGAQPVRSQRAQCGDKAGDLL